MKPKKIGEKKKLRRVNRVVRKNPTANSPAVHLAAALYEKFHGEPPKFLQKVTIRPRSKVLLRIGKCVGVLYEAIRDGERARYIHKFTGNSCPILASSADGSQLELVGGNYNFTAEGIVDRKPKR